MRYFTTAILSVLALALVQCNDGSYVGNPAKTGIRRRERDRERNWSRRNAPVAPARASLDDGDGGDRRHGRDAHRNGGLDGDGFRGNQR